MLEVGESITESMEREVQEEIGCGIKVGHLVGVYSAPNRRLTPPAKVNLIVVCAAASIISGEPGLSSEVVAVDYFDVDDLPAMVPHQSQRIHHAARGAGTLLL